VAAQPVEPLIGDDDAGLFRVNGGIGEVGRVTQRGLGDRLEERRLANVGKTNLDRSHCESSEKGDIVWLECEEEEKKRGRRKGGGRRLK
jgi:hypothetical protein